jgi:biotin operon repressor
MDFQTDRHIGDILKDRNIILRGADRATTQGYTQVPNFLLRMKEITSGDKMTFAMILSYAWQNDSCFPGQAKLAEDMGVDERTVRRHIQALQNAGLLVVQQRGQGKTNIYELNLSVMKGKVRRVRPA